MTSVKTMQTWTTALRPLLVACMLVLLSACGTQERLRAPAPLATPYPDGRIWAVAPFINESGVSGVDTDRLADAMTFELEQVHGIQTMPVNRVLEAMRLSGIERIATAADATTLLNVLDADGLIVGSLTAYDPYPPLELGLAIELFSRETLVATASVDPKALARQPIGEPGGVGPHPVTTVSASGFFDASNHTVRSHLHDYRHGRSQPNSAFGERIYDVSMDLYARFVSYRLLSQLLAAEHMRTVRATAHNTPR